MALTTKQRSRLYDKFKDLIGEEEAEALIAQFPSGELDHPATHDFVRAECALLRTDVKADVAELRAEVKAELGVFRKEVADEFAAVRKEMGEGFAAVHKEMSDGSTELRREIHTSHRDLLRWFIGIWLTTIVLIVGLALRVGTG